MTANVPDLAAWRPASPAAAVGLAVEYLMRKPAFAALPFGQWSQTLFFQVVRGHYLFFVDADQRIRGFLGWALTDEARAQSWVAGRRALMSEECLAGDCAIVNAWAADTAEVNRFMRRAAAKVFAGKSALYFKRRNAEGRERPIRLAVPKHRRLGVEQP